MWKQLFWHCLLYVFSRNYREEYWEIKRLEAKWRKLLMEQSRVLDLSENERIMFTAPIVTPTIEEIDSVFADPELLKETLLELDEESEQKGD